MIKRRPANPPAHTKFQQNHKKVQQSRELIEKALVQDSAPDIVVSSVDECREYLLLDDRSNWAELVLAITYISGAISTEESNRELQESLKYGRVQLLKCYKNTLPQKFRDYYSQHKLAEILKQIINSCRQLSGLNQKLKKLINLTTSRPQIELAVCLLLRSALLQTGKEMIHNHHVQLLGNETEILSDYSISFQYKLLRIASKCLNKCIELVYIHEEGQHIEVYSEQQHGSTLNIIKRHGLIEFMVANNQVASCKNLTHISLSTQSSTRNMLKIVRDQGQKNKLESPRYHDSQGLEKIKLNETSNSIEKRDRSAERMCPRCKHIRKPEQKFCQCRRYKAL